jgi:hypothetical protein
MWQMGTRLDQHARISLLQLHPDIRVGRGYASEPRRRLPAGGPVLTGGSGHRYMYAAPRQPASPSSALTKPAARCLARAQTASTADTATTAVPAVVSVAIAAATAATEAAAALSRPCCRQAPICGSTSRTSRWRGARRAGARSQRVRFGCAAARRRAPPPCRRTAARRTS